MAISRYLDANLACQATKVGRLESRLSKTTRTLEMKYFNAEEKRKARRRNPGCAMLAPLGSG